MPLLLASCLYIAQESVITQLRVLHRNLYFRDLLKPNFFFLFAYSALFFCLVLDFIWWQSTVDAFVLFFDQWSLPIFFFSLSATNGNSRNGLVCLNFVSSLKVEGAGGGSLCRQQNINIVSQRAVDVNALLPSSPFFYSAI